MNDMKLTDDFFRIVSDRADGNVSVMTLELNPDHYIFRAHFPEMPVVPGACLLQILAELTSLKAGRNLAISEIRLSKFINPVLPEKDLTVICSFRKFEDTGSAIVLQAEMESGSNPETKYAKFSMTLK